LLDTNLLIATERGKFNLDRLIADDDESAIAAITVAELGVGVELASGRRKTNRRAFLEDLLHALPVISYDIDVATAHAALLVAVRRAGRPRGAHDLIIAATARATARTVVTSDRSGFDDLPGVLLRAPT
jgi:tRNA(fMet)-specific endonuclease VapC